jgi:hypothetical protein
MGEATCGVTYDETPDYRGKPLIRATCFLTRCLLYGVSFMSCRRMIPSGACL